MGLEHRLLRLEVGGAHTEVLLGSGCVYDSEMRKKSRGWRWSSVLAWCAQNSEFNTEP